MGTGKSKPRMIKIAILIIASVGGIAFTVRSARRAWTELRAKPSHAASDKFFNYPLMVVWYVFLFAFFGGLVVNNLIFP